MPSKERSRNFRREQTAKDKARRRKPAGPRVPKREIYQRAKKKTEIRQEIEVWY